MADLSDAFAWLQARPAVGAAVCACAFAVSASNVARDAAARGWLPFERVDGRVVRLHAVERTSRAGTFEDCLAEVEVGGRRLEAQLDCAAIAGVAAGDHVTLMRDGGTLAAPAVFAPHLGLDVAFAAAEALGLAYFGWLALRRRRARGTPPPAAPLG